MTKLMRLVAVPVLLLVFLLLSAAAYAVEYPDFNPNNKYVNDFAGVISDYAEQKIAQIGRELEDKTTAQVTAVTINSLEGVDIKTYANELFEKWGVGQKGKDNGVLILNSVNDREVWIEVGYGLNPILGTIRVTEFFNEYMKPYLKDGDYDNGFINGFTAISNRIAEDSGVTLDSASGGSVYVAPRQQPARQTSSFNFAPIILVFFLAFDGIFFRFRITAMLLKILFWSSFFRGGRGGRGGWGGGGFGGGGFGGGGFGGRGGGGFGGGSSGGGGGGGKY